jgi:hypothetical protein
MNKTKITKSGRLKIMSALCLLLILIISSFVSSEVSHNAEQIIPGIFGNIWAGTWSFMNGSVGIGTTTPDRPLHVFNATTDIVAKFESSDDISAIMIKDDDTTGYISIANLAVAWPKMSIGSDNYPSTNNLNWDIASKRLGIKDISPGEELSVTGDVEINGYRVCMPKVLMDTYVGNDANSRDIDLGDDYDEIYIYLNYSRLTTEDHLVQAYAIRETYGLSWVDGSDSHIKHRTMADINIFFQGKRAGTNNITLGTLGNDNRGTNNNGWVYKIIAKKYTCSTVETTIIG